MKQLLLTALACTVVALAPTPSIAQTYTAEPSPSAQPSTMPAPTEAPAQAPTTKPAKHILPSGKIKLLKTATLPFSQMLYGVTHPTAEIAKLRAIKSVPIDNIRIVKVSNATRLRLHVYAPAQVVAIDGPFALQDAMVAQTNGSDSPVAILQNVLANINVSHALNNVLNNTNVNATVSLANVLNANKIAISQVLGVYVNGFGIINTIVK